MKLDFWTKAKAPPKMGHNPPPSKEERMFILMMNDIFKRQVADAAKNVKKVLGGDKVELVDRSRWIPEIAELTEGLRFTPFKRGGDEAIADLYKVRKQFGLTEWIEDPAVLQAVKEESFMFARTISDKTADDLQVAMMEGVKAGESVAQIERRVVGVNEAWRDSKRSMMIARTETSRAYTQGQIAAWEQTGVVTEKVWSAASDSCPFCAAMNGKVVGLKEDYLHNGDVLSVSTGGDRTASLKMGYGNVNGPPLHPNCRCSIVAHVVAGRDVGVVDVIQVVKPRRVPVPAVKPPEWDWKKVSLSEKAEMTKRFKPLGFSSPISDIAGTDKVGAELVINNAGKEGYRMMKAHPKLTKMVSKYDQPYALRLSNVRGLDNRINIMGKFSTDPLSGIELATKGRVWGHSPVTIGKWNTGRDINYSFRHEYGHLVWRMNATTGMRQEWRTIYTEQLGGKMSIGSNISKYARKDLTEGFSEAFSAFTSPVYNEANLKLLKCVEDFMKKWVGALQ